MSIFGWSLPPGVTTLPGEEPEFIDVTEKLQAYGRKGHGLCGKDADLNYGGQIVVKEAHIDMDDFARAVIRPYAAIVPAEYDEDRFKSEDQHEAYMDDATEIISSCGYRCPDGWDGDYWTFTMGDKTVSVEYDEECDTDESIEAVVLKLYHAIFAYCADFQKEMTEVQKLIEWPQGEKP